MTSRPAGLLPIEPIACGDCSLGRMSGAGEGQFCPLIIRRYRPGSLLYRAGDPASYVWHVKAGVVGLSRSSDPGRCGDVEALCVPGSFVGLECAVRERYLRTARVMSPAILCGATREGFDRWMRQSDERLAAVWRALLDDPLRISR